jgi:hypothetical protein
MKIVVGWWAKDRGNEEIIVLLRKQEAMEK